MATFKVKSLALYDFIDSKISNIDEDIVYAYMKVYERGKQSSTLYGNDIKEMKYKILK